MEFYKSVKGNSIKLVAKGVLDESVDLFKAIGKALPSEINFHCDGINRVNSIGARHVIGFIRFCKDNGTRVNFFDCSPAIVNMINLTNSTFLKNSVIESICVPFECQSCKEETIISLTSKEVKSSNLLIKSQRCRKCGGVACFVENKNEYFHFLTLDSPTKAA